MTPYWLRALKDRLLGTRNGKRTPCRRRDTQARMSVEPLEDRTMPAVNVLLVSPSEVSFTGTALNTDDLYLRTDRGVLEYSTDGRSFTSDLDRAPGVQRLTVTADTVIRVDISDPLADSPLPEVRDRYR